MPIKKKIVVHNGSWTDKENNTVNKWVTIGAVHEGRDGKDDYLTLEAHINLAGFQREEGESRIFARMFDQKPRDAGMPNAIERVADTPHPFDDDVTF
jgi:hypothetical protein